MNITLIATVISAAAGFGLAWNLQAHQLTKKDLNHAQERIEIQRAARATLERNMSQVATAQAASAKRGIRIRTDVDSSRNAGNGLRIASASAVRAAAESVDTCPVATAALAAVFDQCVGELQTLAERADGHVSDIQTLTESWPK
jgi:hypothetical protein